MTDTADKNHESESEMIQGDGTSLETEGPPKVEEPSPIEKLQSEYDELHEKYLRLAADFENFRKRSIRDTEQSIAQAVGQFARGMMEVADSLDRAMQSEEGKSEGFTQIQKLLIQVMKKQGIEAYDSVGLKFDPSRHEAVAMIPSDSEAGIICDQICRGYCLDDRVIRPAQVIVSQGTAVEQNKQ